MKQKIKIAILGGGGRTGKYLVTQLVKQEYHLKLLLRNPENFSIESPLIEIIKGDAVDFEAVRTLVQDCQTVISTVGQRKDEPLVASQASINILKAMAEFGIKRYILVAGLNVDIPFDKKSSETIIATEWMKNNFPIIHADRQKTYSILLDSEVDWTLVRVPFIEFTNKSGEIIVSLEDCFGKMISATDIATFIIEQISDTTYFKKAPFIANS
ncbi:NAD(P)-dependent oxidoreductase [Mucilaginibacter sp.]|uniref:NAD(P)-dependent oxidoreductase n=1 Tax=Mucilaginibacter sp. TaxID=1882438 RepID=UPI003B009D03